MSDKALALLAEFEALPTNEKLDVANAIMKQLGPWDSGALDDSLLARAGDDLARALDAEENGAQTR